jgi:hypothetical protein
MARRFLRLLKSILFWEYDRGTWQYDVLAALIIILLLLSPRGDSRSWIHQPRSPVPVSDSTATNKHSGTDTLQTTAP